MNEHIKKSTLGQQAAAVIRDKIIKGQYPQGMRLVEEILAEEFNISRACVRDALRFLEAAGILVREINKYTYVKIFSKKEIESLISMRSLLEQQSARMCIEQKTLPVEKMQACISLMEIAAKSGNQSWDAFLQADIGFHQALIEASGDPYILKFWQEVQSQYLTVIYGVFASRPEAFFGSVDNHRLILDTLKRGDSTNLEEIIGSHVLGNMMDITP